MADTYECDYCGERSLYILEWYGFSQYGEFPLVELEFGSCGRFEHMVEILRSDSNKYAQIDGITDAKTGGVEHPELTDLVNGAYWLVGRDDGIYRIGQKIIDRELTPNQLLLFSE